MEKSDTVKLIHVRVVKYYTPRSPIPYNDGKFSIEMGAKEFMDFAFKWEYLKNFLNIMKQH